MGACDFLNSDSLQYYHVYEYIAYLISLESNHTYAFCYVSVKCINTHHFIVILSNSIVNVYT